MGEVKYFTRRSAWYMFKYIMVWIAIVLDIALAVILLGFESDVENLIGNKQIFMFIVVGVVIFTLLVYTFAYFKAISVKFYFFDDHVVQKTKFFRSIETSFAYLGIMEVNVHQGFWQRIFRVGNIKIDYYGRVSLDNIPFNCIAKPKKLKDFVTMQITRNIDVKKIVAN